MSHYCEVELGMTGSQESLIRSLLELGFSREHIEIHADPVKVNGYYKKKDYGTANVIVRRKNMGKAGLRAFGDLGFRQEAGGKWSMHTDDLTGCQEGKWQKQFMSKWAIQKIGVEAENAGHSWSVKYQEEDGKKLAYVSVLARY